jgi:hypothetical protein
MSEPTSKSLQWAALAAERLIGFYPAIQASDPKVYAAGLVKMFSHYPEALVAAAVDPVQGLPGACEFLPTLAKVKAFLEPRYREHLAHQERVAKAKRKQLAAPTRDDAAHARVVEGFRKLQLELKAGN